MRKKVTEAEGLELQVMEISETASEDDNPQILAIMANLASGERGEANGRSGYREGQDSAWSKGG
ncbi:hypothetical protein GCG54_00003800 [Colletotrichum gloeosporioides]|uniref:Uncharacterized protein n=1 Tax=Colletotrichum gloeosporioides TaxID=474922 RepID=A0A8H4FHK3_COLGL|nr:uncharacterized protein GCG54_00003800 [Colletotrichum gloeosporioides]KAF3802340.1 hypothetical protein GCG54_00003800 [Colletotrichum gloeosporioides]